MTVLFKITKENYLLTFKIFKRKESKRLKRKTFFIYKIQLDSIDELENFFPFLFPQFCLVIFNKTVES